jgi:hypothetical protein
MLRLPATATAIIVAAVLLYVGAGLLGAQKKLAAVEPVPARGDYAITLAFAPERFHQLRLQDQGRLVEVRGQTVYLRDVPAQALADVAREFWVVSIARWSGG